MTAVASPFLDDSSADNVTAGVVTVIVPPQPDMIAGMVRQLFAKLGLDTDEKIAQYDRFHDIYNGSLSPSGSQSEIVRFTQEYKNQTETINALRQWSGQGSWEYKVQVGRWFVTQLRLFGMNINTVTGTDQNLICDGYAPKDQPWIYPSEIGVGDIFGVAGTTTPSRLIRAITGHIAHLGLADGQGNCYEALRDGMSKTEILYARAGGGDLIALFRVLTDHITKMKAVERARFRVNNYKYSLGKALNSGCYSPTGLILCNVDPSAYQSGYTPFSHTRATLGNLFEHWAAADTANFNEQPREFCSEAVYNCYYEAGLNIVGSPMLAYPNTITRSRFAICYGYLPGYKDLSGVVKPKE